LFLIAKPAKEDAKLAKEGGMTEGDCLRLSSRDSCGLSGDLFFLAKLAKEEKLAREEKNE